MPESLWQLDTSRAQLQLPGFSAALELSRPFGGLHAIEIKGSPVTGAAILGVELNQSTAPLAPTDAYVRRCDLVATYADAAESAMRTEVYWRAAAEQPRHVLGDLELLVSVQTNLLDSRPQVATCSQLLATEALVLIHSSPAEFAPVAEFAGNRPSALLASGPRCLLFRLPGGTVSYAEMVHPSDPGRSEIQWASGGSATAPVGELRHHMFASDLEKGVILRARVRGLFLAREGDEKSAARHYEAFVAAAPPLTR